MILNFWSAPATCGRYLAAQSEADHYKREMKREQEEIITVPDTGIWMSREQPFMKHCWQIPVVLCVYEWHPDRWCFESLIDHPEAAEIGEIMSQYGLEPHEYGPVVDGLRRNPQAWLDFMMRYDHWFHLFNRPANSFFVLGSKCPWILMTDEINLEYFDISWMALR